MNLHLRSRIFVNERTTLRGCDGIDWLETAPGTFFAIER